MICMHSVGAHTCFLRWAHKLTQHKGGQVCCCFTTLRVLGSERCFFQNHFQHTFIIAGRLLCLVIYRQKMTQSGEWSYVEWWNCIVMDFPCWNAFPCESALLISFQRQNQTCQLMKAQHLQTTSNGTHFWIKSLDGLAATMNLTQNNDVHH